MGDFAHKNSPKKTIYASFFMFVDDNREGRGRGGNAICQAPRNHKLRQER